MSEFRHEYKYICSAQQFAEIENSIAGIMHIDKNAGENRMYTIRSLYFDDYFDSCLYDNINGFDPREKFRIRIYNAELSYLRLELKRKESGKTQKISCRIDREMCSSIIHGKPLRMDTLDNSIYRKFCLQQNERFLKPKVIIEYDRIPYIYKDGNVRVTFDKNIRSSAFVGSFMDSRIVSRPVMPVNHHILEVKFDELIPDFIYSLIQTKKLRQTTFSKYYICRKYNLGGNRL